MFCVRSNYQYTAFQSIEVSNLETELEAQANVISKSNSLKLYMDDLPDLLEFATNNEPLKMQFLKAFDIRVTMYPEGKYKSVDWALFSGALTTIPKLASTPHPNCPRYYGNPK